MVGLGWHGGFAVFSQGTGITVVGGQIYRIQPAVTLSDAREGTQEVCGMRTPPGGW